MIKPAPAMDGDKIMRLHSQTAKIEGGFVLFPKEAHWLNAGLEHLRTISVWLTKEVVEGLDGMFADMAFNRYIRGF